jgi:drug/metabolite transporter (DMT)-like permease
MAAIADRDALRRVPPRRRALLALLLAPIGVALLAGGVLVTVASAGPAGHLVGVLVGLISLVLLGIAHGLFQSARQDRAEQRLDAAIRAASAPCGPAAGACGSAAGACGSAAGACGSGACGSAAAGACAAKALPRT